MEWLVIIFLLVVVVVLARANNQRQIKQVKQSQIELTSSRL